MKRKIQAVQNSSGQSNRPCVAPIKEVRDRRSCLTEEDVQRLVRVELERAKSHSVEYCQSCTGNALKDIVRSLENAVQKLLEAVELASIYCPHLGRDNSQSTAKNDAKNLRLQLQTKLLLPIFTGKKLEGERGAHISVALINAKTRDVITSGPESSIKLDVVVLEGDFNKEDEDNWAQEEFEKYMVKEREGKGPLLIGNLQVMLKGGVGELGEMVFTDNSSWTRSKTFRVGLKVASGYGENTRIREATTDAFRVKEYRGESYRKHYPPASDDEIWRLVTIAKDGRFHQKLNEAGIYQVEDFLLQLFTDPNKLREIIGKNVTPKTWDILVDHAKTCKINWNLYLCYSDGMRKHGAVFNTDGQLIGLIKDREHGDTIVKKALDNWNDVREFNGETFSGSMQEKSSSSFPSQVFEGQIENLTPVQHNLAPRVCSAPVGPEAPPVDTSSTAEGHNSATALALPMQLQNTNSGNAMKLSEDESVRPATQQPISIDPLNVLIPRGDNGITNVGLPIQ